MDTSEDGSPSKSYETPPPSASGVATRCEIPAQPKVDNIPLGNYLYYKVVKTVTVEHKL